DPVWSPDGKRIAFRASGGGAANIYWKPADGSGPEERLTISPHFQLPTSFSPDGKWLAFGQIDPATGFDIWLLRLEGERKPRPFMQTPSAEREAMFSPDGRWIAYSSTESGRPEVYVVRFPEGASAGKSLVSTDGGEEPVWGHNGRELFYRRGDQMMSVDVTL